MKAHLAQMLQHLHGHQTYRQVEAQVRKLQSHNMQLERTLRGKEREIDQLRHQIANYQARLQELMGTDELTGLPNRHVFKEHLTHSLKRAVRLGYSLSLMLVDINDLREINLRYGHEMGDKVLVEAAKILRTSVREIDMPARWSGQELVAVLHETDAEGATLVAERVRNRIALLSLKDKRDDKDIRVTATLALSSYPKHSNDPEALLEAACEALILAKDQGCTISVATR